MLKSMLPSISRTNIKMEQSIRIGQLIEELSCSLTKPGSIMELRTQLQDIREYHKLLPFPTTREEFENRARLYAIANDLERFLTIEEGMNAEHIQHNKVSALG